MPEMSVLPAAAVDGHFDSVADQRPTSRSLYQRWEDQQWSVSDIDLDADREEWAALRGAVRERVAELVRSFLIGEYTGLDLLSPIMLTCPDAVSLEFLETQVADETRHIRLMMRIATEVLGMPERSQEMLAVAWNSRTPAHRSLSGFAR